MAGLTRKKVKVRSKSGKVYQRSVMVKSGGKPSGRLRSAGADHTLANSTLKRGLANAGMGLGAAFGGRGHNALHMIGGGAAGLAAGGGVGHLLSKTKLSRNAKVGIGLTGHLIGFGSSVANLHHQITRPEIGLQQMRDSHARQMDNVSSIMHGLGQMGQTGRSAPANHPSNSPSSPLNSSPAPKPKKKRK